MHQSGGRKFVWAGVAGVVVLLAAFMVTGFVTPGFMLEGKTGTTSVGGGPRATPSKSKGPVRSLKKALSMTTKALKETDKQALATARCPSAYDRVGKLGTLLGSTRQLFVHDSPAELSRTGNRWWWFSINVAPRGKPNILLNVILERQHGLWCVMDVKAGDLGGPQYGFPTHPKGYPYEAKATAQRFLALVNAGDYAEAATFSDKPPAATEAKLREAAQVDGKIAIDPSVPDPTPQDSSYDSYTVRATREGEPVSALLVITSSLMDIFDAEIPGPMS